MLSSCCLPGHRNLIVSVLAAACLLTAATSGRAQQQPQLSPTLLNAETLDAEQRQEIEDFADFYVQRMLDSEELSDVSDARQRLIDPLRNRSMTQPPAHTALSEAVAERLGIVVDQNTVFLRINALIIAGELSSSIDEVVPLLVDSLGHPHPGVRYRAAKTIAQISQSHSDESGENTLDPQIQQALLDALAQPIANEGSDMVLEQMYEAAGSLTVEEARQVLFNVLAQRVDTTYTGGVHRGLEADRRGLDSLRESLAYDRAANREIDQPLRQLTATAARLLDIVTVELQEGELNEELEAIAVRTVGDIEGVFDLAMTHFAPGESGRELSSLAEDGDYDDLRLNALEWIGTEDSPGILTDSAVGIPFAQLQPAG